MIWKWAAILQGMQRKFNDDILISITFTITFSQNSYNCSVTQSIDIVSEHSQQVTTTALSVILQIPNSLLSLAWGKEVEQRAKLVRTGTMFFFLLKKDAIIGPQNYIFSYSFSFWRNEKTFWRKGFVLYSADPPICPEDTKIYFVFSILPLVYTRFTRYTGF